MRSQDGRIPLRPAGQGRKKNDESFNSREGGVLGIIPGLSGHATASERFAGRLNVPFVGPPLPEASGFSVPDFAFPSPLKFMS